MVSRFAFTPGCCCEGAYPCLPPCQVIYKGHNNLNYHLRDNFPEDFTGEWFWGNDYSFIIFNTIGTFDKFPGGCVYFDIENNGGNKRQARPRQTYSDGNSNRLIATLNYEDGFAPAIYYLNVPLPTAINRVVRLSYDNRWHNLVQKDWGKYWGVCYDDRPIPFRYDVLYCLPFNEPINFASNGVAWQPVQLTDLEDGEDEKVYYKTLEECTWYPDECYVGTGPGTPYINANEIPAFIDGIDPTAKRPGLDFIDVRLWGWGSVGCDYPLPFGDYYHYNELVKQTIRISFDKRVNPGSPDEPDSMVVISGDFATRDYEVTKNNFNPDTFNTAGGDDHPILLLSNSIFHDIYKREEDNSVTESQVIFGTADVDNSSNPPDTTGDSATIPTNWFLVDKYRAPCWELHSGDGVEPDSVNDNDVRFHGAYWMFADYSPCGGPLLGDEGSDYEVTSGKLWNVPVAEYDVTFPDPPEFVYKYWDSITGYAPLNRLEISWSKSSDQLGVDVLRKKYVTELLEKKNYPAEDETEPEYWDRVYTGVSFSDWQYHTFDGNFQGNTWPTFLHVPEDRQLHKIVWKTFYNKLEFVSEDQQGNKRIAAQGLGIMARLDHNKNADWYSLRPGFPPWYRFIHGIEAAYPYSVKGVEYPMCGDYGEEGFGPDWSIDDYNKCIKSVNGTGIRQFEIDGETVYMPVMSTAQAQALLNYSSSVNVCYYNVAPMVYGLDTWDKSDVKLYAYNNFYYIAIWKKL